MKDAVVDTMVFAYALFNEPKYRQEALAVLNNTGMIHVPDSFRAEFCNVAWQWVTHRQLSLEKALQALNRAEALVSAETPSANLWHQALEVAVQARHPAYDTLFIVLAERKSLPLVTYDKKLLQTFPEIAVQPGEYLG